MQNHLKINLIFKCLFLEYQNSGYYGTEVDFILLLLFYPRMLGQQQQGSQTKQTLKTTKLLVIFIRFNVFIIFTLLGNGFIF